MKLTHDNIRGIERLLDEGLRVQLFVEKDKVLDTGHGETLTRAEQLNIEGLPPDEEFLHFSPVVVSTDETVPVRLVAGQGEGAIELAVVVVPAGTNLTGFLTAKHRV